MMMLDCSETASVIERYREHLEERYTTEKIIKVARAIACIEFELAEVNHHIKKLIAESGRLCSLGLDDEDAKILLTAIRENNSNLVPGNDLLTALTMGGE